MITSVLCPALSTALTKLKTIIAQNQASGKTTVIFCEDRLTLAAERAVCAAVGGTFSVLVYTFARFLSSERGKRDNILSRQGSAMAIRRIIEDNKDNLQLFGKFSAAASAGAVYDTIALLYASKISADDLNKAVAKGLLESKLHDISLIYAEYVKYLESTGKIDRNAYLCELPAVISSSDKIRGAEVIFLGFQSFTHSSAECVRAAFNTAKNVTGLFIDGDEDIYVHEGATTFNAIAKDFGGASTVYAKSTLCAPAERLRTALFNPESLYSSQPVYCNNVHIYEAADDDEEIEFIAAQIKKHVIDGGKRYLDIAVMLPDVANSERAVKRIFSQYNIPCYTDRRHKLSEHFISEFIVSCLSCATSSSRQKNADGSEVRRCYPSVRDTDTVISSPLFPATRADKDAYRNYALRLAAFRGGIAREPKKEIVDSLNFSYAAVQRVRALFFEGLDLIPLGSSNVTAVCNGIRALLKTYKTEERLIERAEYYKDIFPTTAEFSRRVYDAVLSVIDEAEDISGGNMPLKDFIKILKSGFAATEISLIPPKSDAVFVGDIAATANTGCDVVFAAGLTDAVPMSSEDTALLTDREIIALESALLDISPKIRQVNMRRRETAALNVCSFNSNLYLSYPSKRDAEECVASEIIEYAEGVFAAEDGSKLKPVSIDKIKPALVPYYCSESLPALRRLTGKLPPATISAINSVLEQKGCGNAAKRAVKKSETGSISDGRGLFISYGAVSPTVLETYYDCPYRNFMQQGLKLQEREEGTMRPLDTGNFIHTVLQTLAPEVSSLDGEQAVRERATEICQSLLNKGTYSSLADSKSGQYTSAELVKEACAVSVGMYEQLANSSFDVQRTESRCEIQLMDGVKLNGRIDRVDSCGDMVRIIDYKTGSIDTSPTTYYMGRKLQLPLYLTAASNGMRAVGAYYFPASVYYHTKDIGVFRLQGFMDGSDDVVNASDLSIQPKKLSAYVDAYLAPKKKEGAMETEEFKNFLQYSQLVARRGAQEMLEGNISPSPAKDACSYCKMGGSCGFIVGVDGEERDFRTLKCADVADIVRREKGDK